jgi:hypothetical protein
VSEQAHLLFRFLNIAVVAVFIAHWIACLLFAMTTFEGSRDDTSWLELQGLSDASVAEKYVNALYWVITTTCTVGYGDFHPVTTTERLVVICCMIL